jgi:stress-induced morphogen
MQQCRLALPRPPLVVCDPMTAEQMRERLLQNYPESKVEVYDLTGTQDHWEVYVESTKFAGLSRIQQHQHVMGCFGPELKTGEVHALSIKTKIL